VAAAVDLKRDGDYDCGTCNVDRRRRWGCHGGGTAVHFAGTEHETRTCPRRILLRNPDVVGVFDVRRDLGEGGVGPGGAEYLSVMAVDGLAVVDDAVAFRTRTEREQEQIDAAMRAAAQAVRDGD
jgi:hypothetical protein